MAKLKTLPIEEAQGKKSKRRKKGKILEKTKDDIRFLPPGQAGRYWVKDEKEGCKYRNRINRAADALSLKVRVKKAGNEFMFWVEQ